MIIDIFSPAIAIAELDDLSYGKELHSSIAHSDDLDINVLNVLIQMYGKCGSLQTATQVFNKAIARADAHISTWNSMMSEYISQGQVYAAIQLFRSLPEHKMKPNDITFTLAFSACAEIADLDLAIQLHNTLESSRTFSPSLSLETTIVNAYSKCGDWDTSLKLFSSIRKRFQNLDVVSWNAMLAACANHGNA